jgi:2,3-bisphosphoglycerate-independent phosphoglycerate mutase
VLTRLISVIDKLGGAMLITADHGNADEMYETDKKTGKAKVNRNGVPKAKTSHTLNKVPFIMYDNTHKGDYALKAGEFGLSNIASTLVNLLGFDAPDIWDESMITFVKKG